MELGQQTEGFLDIVMTKARDKHGLVRGLLTYPDRRPLTPEWVEEMELDAVSDRTGLPKKQAASHRVVEVSRHLSSMGLGSVSKVCMAPQIPLIECHLHDTAKVLGCFLEP